MSDNITLENVKLVENKPVSRTIVIETDGTKLNVVKCELSNLEIIAMCNIMLRQLNG